MATYSKVKQEIAIATGATKSGKNLIINGGMQVAQRGTSFTSSSVNEYSLDRWRTEGYGLSTVISQQSFTVGQTDVPDFPTNYVRVTTNNTIASGEFWSFQQRIEKPQVIPIGTQNFTLSFWAKSVSGTISATAFSFGIGSDKVDCPEITTSWQKITTTINRVVSSSSAYESTYLVYLGPGKAAISIDIANVQLEIGDVASPFEHRSYGDELLACMRYYQQIGGETPANVLCTGQCTSSTLAQFLIPFIVPVRDDPTCSVSNQTHFRVFNAAVSGIPDTTNITIAATNAASYGSFRIVATVSSGLVAGNATMLSGSNSNNNAGIIKIDAEL